MTVQGNQGEARNGTYWADALDSEGRVIVQANGFPSRDGAVYAVINAVEDATGEEA